MRNPGACAYISNKLLTAQVKLVLLVVHSIKLQFLRDIFSGLSLLMQPLQGLLPIILDDESKMAKATDAALIKKCDTIHCKHPNYEIAKLSYPSFTIRHYAGTVSCCKWWNLSHMPYFSNPLVQPCLVLVIGYKCKCKDFTSRFASSTSSHGMGDNGIVIINPTPPPPQKKKKSFWSWVYQALFRKKKRAIKMIARSPCSLNRCNGLILLHLCLYSC